ncbi:DNA ligase D [Legionella birminghamensis]|uniref:DNA ligase (ATP) n=4 Tax=Legionella birminghamensis TaxID=28083 RepID=A0A378JQQ3_9GAMM|nr:DNA ligase D [Legionella birminghamensis]STX60985.1 Putative DNA ligase-like protein Rv0938/MT0965 [Legionella birminghamensis]
MGLGQYRAKRNFSRTCEPQGSDSFTNQFRFVIQKHQASHLHYDFRLELQGVLKSWAVPKGPSSNPAIKRTAFQTEDHPLDYAEFEGEIPKGEYGAGTVILWDNGIWEPFDDNPIGSFYKGHLRFSLHGEKLQGDWELIRSAKENTWRLVKMNDEFSDFNPIPIVERMPASVLSGLTLEQFTDNPQAKPQLVHRSAKQRIDERLARVPNEAMPEKMSPQLTTLADTPPTGDAWLHEIKWDGYRMLAFKKGDAVRIISRNHIDWTVSFQVIADKIRLLPFENLILDGEMVIFDESNRASFQCMQNAIDAGSHSPFRYYCYDMPYYHSKSLLSLPLIERKSLLKAVLRQAPSAIRYNDHIIGEGREVFANACRLGLEGIVSKLADSPYQTKRSKSWLKIKCVKRQEYVIAGFTPPQGARRYFGSLYLGVFNEKGKLEYSGNVGTGFTEASLKTVYQALLPLVIEKNPFTTNPPGCRTATWVKPELVAEVEFSEWTKESNLRHPSFKGLRRDKTAKTIHREETLPVSLLEKVVPESAKPSEKSRVRLSHPEKLLYPEDGISKQQLYDYYEAVAEWMLPFIRERPLTLLRCPGGYQQCFYQKHRTASSSPALKPIPIQDKKNRQWEDYLTVEDEKGLLSLVQMGVLEIHPWGSTIAHLEQADVIVFDLDPAPDVAWKEVVLAAQTVRHYLNTMQLTSFVKTTGGKGLHVVVPILPEHDWEAIKRFTKAFVETLETIAPDRYVSNMAKKKRQGKLFIDYLRNQWDTTAIAPYSTRARPKAPVAVPLHWDELTDQFEDTFYTLHSLLKRLHTLRENPWQSFFTLHQSLDLD